MTPPQNAAPSLFIVEGYERNTVVKVHKRKDHWLCRTEKIIIVLKKVMLNALYLTDTNEKEKMKIFIEIPFSKCRSLSLYSRGV